jgi:L-ascorbate metabolism protein UlaG (beta-lactamase superfamily)
MRVEWYGQSAFRLASAEATVFIDPLGDMSAMAAARGLQIDYPPIERVECDLVLVTHEHRDHNGVEAIGGSPAVLRSTAGRLQSPVGEVVAIASEHDAAAGTQRGPNTIFVFSLEGLRVCHLGDLGQSTLRPEQAEAIGSPVDLLFIPVGGGPTIGAAEAEVIAGRLAPRWIVPMHYRTARINFLEPADAFLDAFGDVRRLDATAFETRDLGSDSGPIVVVPAAP